jgi:hypothetical protein
MHGCEKPDRPKNPGCTRKTGSVKWARLPPLQAVSDRDGEHEDKLDEGEASVPILPDSGSLIERESLRKRLRDYPVFALLPGRDRIRPRMPRSGLCATRRTLDRLCWARTEASAAALALRAIERGESALDIRTDCKFRTTDTTRDSVPAAGTATDGTTLSRP